uniref:Uncharacterized protein n=1 Tax=Pipistrellus kuhlii TaxID=59472 RepID=A0A7J7XCA1_PIPKU|nr:hypothetical protein mPipKuh1_010664 [Pipistrellus kuhlii]
MGGGLSKGKGCSALSQGGVGWMMAAPRSCSFFLIHKCKCSHWQEVLSSVGLGQWAWNADGMQVIRFLLENFSSLCDLISGVQQGFFVCVSLPPTPPSGLGSPVVDTYKWPFRIILPYRPNISPLCPPFYLLVIILMESETDQLTA